MLVFAGQYTFNRLLDDFALMLIALWWTLHKRSLAAWNVFFLPSPHVRQGLRRLFTSSQADSITTLEGLNKGLGLFRTMRSRDHDVVVVRRTINLGYWEFGIGREWGGVEKGEASL
jgi:hypothetical protein